MTTPTSKWQAAGSSVWSNPSNWLGGVPTAASVITIAGAPGLTVSYNEASGSIAGLTLTGDTLQLAGGSLTVTGAVKLSKATIKAGSGKTFITRGATAIASGATIEGGAWDNYGSVTQSGGTVAIGDSTTTAAKIVNEARATWTVTDASPLSVGTNKSSQFVNYGAFVKTSQNVTIAVTCDFYSYGSISSAANGDIKFEGAYTYLSGTFIGSGMIDCGDDAVVQMGAVDVTQKCCQTNWGTTQLVGTMTMDDGSTIMNAAGADWEFDGDVSLLLGAGQTAGPDINGPGTISKIAGTGTSYIGIDVEAEGAVDVATGTLAFEGDDSAFTGAVSGAGVFEIAGGAAEIGAGASLSVADWTLAGGVTTLGEAVSYAGLFTGAAGATLTLGASDGLNLSGVDVFSGLTIDGAGALTVSGDASLSAATIGGGVNFVDSGYVTQTGGLTLGDSSATDAASLTVGNGGTWILEGTAGIARGADAASTIAIESGLFGKTGAGVSVVAPAIVNDGVNIPQGAAFTPLGIGLNAGTLDLQGAVTGTGTDTVAGDGSTNAATRTTLEFDASVAATQTVVFYASNAALFVNDLADFHAAITDFDLGGATDYLLVGGGYTFAGASETSTATTLSFTKAGAAGETLTLTGDYVGKSFAASAVSGGALSIQ